MSWWWIIVALIGAGIIGAVIMYISFLLIVSKGFMR